MWKSDNIIPHNAYYEVLLIEPNNLEVESRIVDSN